MTTESPNRLQQLDNHNSLGNFLAAALQYDRRSKSSQHHLIAGAARPGWVEIGSKDCLVLCSNDYLGLACEPTVIEAAREATQRYGAGARAARSFGGDTQVHQELEQALAAFKSVDAALLFNSGLTCNMGVVSALMQEGDLILSDQSNHASIIDGCRLSRANVEVFRHRDMDHLSELLQVHNPAGKTMIVTAGVFSMAGTIAPLDQIVGLAEEHGAFVMIDEAHATGVYGACGEGTAAHFGVQDRVAIHMGTLGKALGSVGGFIAGSRDLIDYLSIHARPLLFSTSMPPSAAAAALAALNLLRLQPERVARLWHNARQFHAGLAALGFELSAAATPINPIYFADEQVAAEASRLLLERGLFVQAVSTPFVPAGTSRLRTIVSAAHTQRDIDFALQTFADVGNKLGLLKGGRGGGH